jgi:tRNA nucleotidyltransferase (CCA-adding enzyme)
MEIITTHINADFDAFASMVAAQKLYPDAVLAFPGSQEKHLREFFIESAMYILSIKRAKDIDLDAVTRLILVDTRLKSRIGRFAELAESPSVEVHVYDHHPDSGEDIRGHFELIKEVGATVTLLIGEIRSRGIEVNAEEATILTLGIYEDTGSFHFSSTTAEDLRAASWLLERGANLNMVSTLMTNEMNREQIEVLHKLIEGSETISVGGLEVIVTVASVEGYVGDLAILVHKFKDMENMYALFAVVRMEDRIHVIARSRVDEVNVGEILAEFGGGGHPTAASATIRDMALYEVRERLIQLLNERVRPKQRADEIMTRHVATVGPDQTIREAAELFGRYQVSSLPVDRSGSLLGILHRHVVERALHHGLDDAEVHEFMNPGIVFVTPDDSIDQVLRITVEGRHRLVPVIDKGKLAGVISRSDLLEHLRLPRRSDSAGPEEFPTQRVRHKSVRKLMDELLPREVLDILRRAGETAAERGEEVYLVGGAIRDLMLRNQNLDIDLVIEGQGIPFARALAQTYPGSRVRGHEKFGTAVVLFDNGFKVDVVTARHEYYVRPGALPIVEMSSIKRDLYRRDFTMNTLAIALSPKSMGRLIDFFGGARDIKDKVIRVLHNLAFVEDPTRILRAVRFSSRFGFAIAKHTLTLMKAAIKMKMFDKVEGKRLLNELIHILDEKAPVAPLTLMAGYQIPQALHPALDFSGKTMELVEAVSGVLAWWKYLFMKDSVDPWRVYFLGLTDRLSDHEYREVLQRMSYPGSQGQEPFRERTRMRHSLATLARDEDPSPSRVCDLLSGLSMEALLFMMAKTGRDRTRMAISDYINTLRYVRPLLTGNDLVAMGHKPGPVFGAMLGALRDARLDGRVVTREDEMELLTRRFPVDATTEPHAAS